MSAADLEKNNIFYHFHQSIKNAEANVTKCYGKKNSLSRALKGIKIRIDSFVAYIKKGLKKGRKQKPNHGEKQPTHISQPG